MMKLARIFAVLAALWFGIQPAAAGWLLNSYRFGVAAATVTFLQCATDTTDGSSFTFSGQNTGTASSDRYTIVGVLVEDSGVNHSVNSLTIGGDSATEIVDQGATGFLVNSAIYIMANSADTSEDIVVTPSEIVTSMSICVWQANGLESATATDTASAGDTDANPLTLDLDVSANGIAVGVCIDQNTTGTWTWTGMTERDDAAPGEHIRAAADYDEDSSASSPLTASCDSSNAGTTDQNGSAASFR